MKRNFKKEKILKSLQVDLYYIPHINILDKIIVVFKIYVPQNGICVAVRNYATIVDNVHSSK